MWNEEKKSEHLPKARSSQSSFMLLSYSKRFCLQPEIKILNPDWCTTLNEESTSHDNGGTLDLEIMGVGIRI